MTIKVGDKIPSITLKRMGEKGPEDVDSSELFAGGKVVMFAVPGAFTPGCSKVHLPGFVVNADKIKAKGVARILCMSVNDAFVMAAWGKDQNAEELVMLADADAAFARALGLELDASAHGLGIRSKRFSLVAEDGVVTHLNVEPDGAGIDVSTAEKIMEAL